MQVTNKTRYETRDLRRIFCEVIRRSSKVEGPVERWQIKHLSVTVKTTKGVGRYKGWATLHGATMFIKLPDEKATPTMTAWLFDHELQHIRGYGHRQMSRNSYRWEEWEWAKDLPLRMKAEKTKPVEDLQLRRYQHVVEMVEQKTKATRRLQGQLKKWTERKKYYEKALAAAGKLSNKEV